MSDFLTAGFTLQNLNTIIKNIKTDIWLLDIFITIFIMFSMNKATSYFQNRFNRINIRILKEYLNNLFRKRKKRTYFSNRKGNYEGSYNTCQEFILAICDYIDKSISDKNLDVDISSIYNEEEFTMNYNEGYGDDESALIRLGKIKIPKFNIVIECELHNKEREEKQGGKSEYKEIEINIYSDTLLEIKIFVDYILNIYEKNIDLVSNEQTNIYSCREFSKESSTPKYFEVKLFKKSNFNNIFFENKEILIKMIDDVYYGKRDRLSLLLHGPPGTGKDSVTVAICRYLNELEVKNNNNNSTVKKNHIIRYPMDVFKKSDEFFKIFFGDYKISGKKIPNNQQIRFFPEVEKYSDIIIKKKLKDVVIKNPEKNINDTMFEFIKENPEINVELDDNNLQLFEDMKKNLKKTSNNFLPSELKLANLDECLDSILNQPRTINIFTSNLPIDLIDDILIRHERLDPFYLGYCSSEIITKIIKHYYNYNDYINSKQFDKLKNVVPADISYHCKNNTNIQDCIKSVLCNE